MLNRLVKVFKLQNYVGVFLPGCFRVFVQQQILGT